MSELNLDHLRSGWGGQMQRLGDQLSFDVHTLRATLAGRSDRAFRRHSRWLRLGLLASALGLLALGVFMVQHHDDAIYRLLAAPLALLVGWELVVDWRQWRALAVLDPSAPVAQVQAGLDRLQERRLRLARGIMATSVLLWLPLVLVVCKGLSGVDLLNWLHPSVVQVNLLIGLLFIPTSLLLSGWIARRYRHRPGWKGFLAEVAGHSWSRARGEYAALERLDEALVSGDAALLSQGMDPGLREPLVAALRPLKSRLGWGIAVHSILMLSTGLFNAGHGGQPQFLAPALLLHLVWVAHLVFAIAQRHHLQQWETTDGSTDQLRQQLLGLLRWRQLLARVTGVALPLLGLALVQVLAQIAFGLDLFSSSSWPQRLFALLSAGLLGLLLHRRQIACRLAPGLPALQRNAQSLLKLLPEQAILKP